MAALFTSGNDDVNFGILTAEQKEAIAAANGTIAEIYDALDGNDFISLPDLAEAELTAGVYWDYTRTFHAGGGDDAIIGGDGNDRIDAGAGNDILVGGLGDDVLTGGDGSDLADYGSASAGVSVNLSLAGAQATGGAGLDTLSGIESLSGSIFADALTGDEGANNLFGMEGNDTLHTAGGDDFLTGGAGDDLIDGGSGTDTASYTGSASGVTVSLAKVGAQVTGGAGTDTLIGIENLIGSSYGDALTGNSLANTLTGNGGDDTLDGGAGADVMAGGSGDDLYYVDNAGDVVTENGGGGTDEIRSSISLTLSANVENLRLSGAATSGTGNGLDNIIRGTNAANSLYGLDGSDRLYSNGGDDTIEGGAGDDYLFGADGNDTLNGGAGYDRLYGGVGDDTYIVTDADDYAYELAGEGQDRVVSSVDHQLRADVEDLTLTGSAAIGEGNASNNTIVGTDQANRLYGYDGDDVLFGNGGDDYLLGGAGNDQLTGGAGYDRTYGGTGDDTYVVTDLTDYAYENAGEGYDTVIASLNHQLRANIEQLVLSGTEDLRGFGTAIDNMIVGNSGDNLLYGNDGNDTLLGNAGNDIVYGENGNDALNGGTGQDRFYGGAGADLFTFDDGDFAGMSSGTADRIHDFSQLEGDRISLTDVDANTSLAADQAFTFIGSGAFTGVAGELRYQQIVGNTYVQGDTNGDGVADFWVRVEGLHTLVASDFLL